MILVRTFTANGLPSHQYITMMSSEELKRPYRSCSALLISQPGPLQIGTHKEAVKLAKLLGTIAKPWSPGHDYLFILDS